MATDTEYGTPVPAVVSDALAVFKSAYGNLQYSLHFVSSIEDNHDESKLGVCDFGVVPPAITVRVDIPDQELIDVLLHEFAHLVCGRTAEHNAAWRACHEDLHDRLARRRIDRVLTHASGDGG